MSEHSRPSGPDLRLGIALEALPEGQPILGHVDGEAAILVRRGTRIDAVSATCTHYGGPLAEGLIEADQVHCPWHHACFSLCTGAVLGPPGLNPLRCWIVDVRAGKAFVGATRPLPPPDAPPHSPAAVLIVGAGAAGEAAATELRRAGYIGPITLLAAEADTPGDRPNLSKDYLAGKAPRHGCRYAARSIGKNWTSGYYPAHVPRLWIRPRVASLAATGASLNMTRCCWLPARSRSGWRSRVRTPLTCTSCAVWPTAAASSLRSRAMRSARW